MVVAPLQSQGFRPSAVPLGSLAELFGVGHPNENVEFLVPEKVFDPSVDRPVLRGYVEKTGYLSAASPF
jgi:hypothetical protein